MPYVCALVIEEYIMHGACMRVYVRIFVFISNLYLLYIYIRTYTHVFLFHVFLFAHLFIVPPLYVCWLLVVVGLFFFFLNIFCVPDLVRPTNTHMCFGSAIGTTTTKKKRHTKVESVFIPSIWKR